MKKRRLSPGILVAILFFLVIWISWLRMNSSPASDGGGPGAQGTAATGEAVYPEEIRYGDFEWGSDVITVSNECNERYVESMTPEWSEAYSVMGLSSYQLGYLVYQYGGHSAGGHYARDFKMFFHYGHSDGSISLAPEDSELYLIIMNFDVLDYEGTYDDLYAKLTAIYGDGVTSVNNRGASQTNSGRYKYTVTSTEWRGANDTGVMLTKSIENKGTEIGGAWDNYVTLTYGKTDSGQTLLDLSREYTEYQIAEAQAAAEPEEGAELPDPYLPPADSNAG